MPESTTTFGFGMVTAQVPAGEKDATRTYREVLELAEHAEDLGFDSVWLSEHHFVDDGYMPSLLPVAAAIAARTSRITIATGILVAPLHDPVRLAEDAATVSLVAAGRLLLGIGAGYRDEEFAGLGVEKTGLGGRLDLALDVLGQAWAPDGVVDLPGRAPVRVTPKPVEPPPVWIGARTPAGIRRVAARASGLLAARVSPAELEAQVRALIDAAEAIGRDPGELRVGVHCPVLAWPTGDAWSMVEEHLHYVEWKYKDMMGEPYGTRTAASRVPAQPSDRGREVMRASSIVGTPDEVAAGIRDYEQAACGLPFTFIPRLYWPTMELQQQKDVMRVFAEQVIPLARPDSPTKS